MVTAALSGLALLVAATLPASTAFAEVAEVAAVPTAVQPGGPLAAQPGPLSIQTAIPMPMSYPETGAEVSLPLRLLNTGSVNLVLQSVSHPTTDGDTCSDSPVIPAGRAIECLVFYAKAATPGTTATVPVTFTAVPAGGAPATYTADIDVLVASSDVPPGMWLEAVADRSSAGASDPVGVDLTFMGSPYGDTYTITSLTSARFGNLLDPGNDLVTANTCTARNGDCRYTVRGPFTDTVTAVATDDEGATTTRTQTLSVATRTPLIEVELVPSSQLVGVGASVDVDVVISNTTTSDVLLDSVLGTAEMAGVLHNISCPTGELSIEVRPGRSAYSCRLRATLSSTTTLAVVARAHQGTLVDDPRATSLVSLVAEAKPAATLTLSAATPTVSSGTPVRFTVRLLPSAATTATLAALRTDRWGSLLDPANTAVSANTCVKPAGTTPGFTARTCQFTAKVTGSAGAAVPVTLVATARTGYGSYDFQSARTVRIAWSRKSSGAWAAARAWPRLVVGGTVLTPATTTGTVFVVPATCRSLATRTTRATLRSTTTGSCGVPIRLAKAALTALLNERSFGRQYPGASTTAEVIRRTNAALATRRAASMISLAAFFESWN